MNPRPTGSSAFKHRCFLEPAALAWLRYAPTFVRCIFIPSVVILFILIMIYSFLFLKLYWAMMLMSFLCEYSVVLIGFGVHYYSDVSVKFVLADSFLAE